MLIVETRIFTRLIKDLLPDEEYRALQSALVLRPEQGSIIPGGGGLRKVRWRKPGAGKRGGLRVFYFWDAAETIYMIFAIEKGRQDDLTPAQLKELGRVVKKELR